MRINWTWFIYVIYLITMNAWAYLKGDSANTIASLAISLVICLVMTLVQSSNRQKQIRVYRLIAKLDRAFLIAYRDIAEVDSHDIHEYLRWREHYKQTVALSNEKWLKCIAEGRLPLMGQPGYKISDVTAVRIKTEIERAWPHRRSSD